MRLLKLFVLTLISTPFLTASPSSHGATVLSLDEYLNQVKGQNEGVKGAVIASKAGELRSEEGAIPFSTTAFLNTQLTSESKLTAPVFIPYDSQILKSLSFGVSQLTPFGLQAKLRYDVSTFNYINPVIPASLAAFGSGFPLSIANASPVLELTQSLWSNGFGSSTRAQKEMTEGQAMASSYANRFQAKVSLSQAESTYWRLALARQSVKIQQEALNRAKRIYDWALKRSHLHLGDQSDVLQSQAGAQARELELEGILTEESSAARAFNTARNISSDVVLEQLAEIDPEMMDRISLPEKAEFRDDVKAAKETVRASKASATIAMERNLPTLDLFALFALNGQYGTTIFSDLSDAIRNSFTFNRPTQTVGLRFSVPLFFGTTSKVRSGWQQEQVAAEMNYERKVFEQDRAWTDLTQNFRDQKKQLDLTRQLEKIQKAKLENEQNRLRQGRSTTYQVLLFEQDYLVAQLTRIRNQATILSLIAQMKLFGESL